MIHASCARARTREPSRFRIDPQQVKRSDLEFELGSFFI